MWQTIRKEEVFQKLRTNDKTGLTEEEALKREKEDGKNKIKENNQERIMIKYFK